MPSSAAGGLSRWLRARQPTSGSYVTAGSTTAFCLVYDNYIALAVGFGLDERASKTILSVAFYPKSISLFFLQGAGLDDPNSILKGSGTVARHVVLYELADIDRPAIHALDLGDLFGCRCVFFKRQREIDPRYDKKLF